MIDFSIFGQPVEHQSRPHPTHPTHGVKIVTRLSNSKPTSLIFFPFNGKCWWIEDRYIISGNNNRVTFYGFDEVVGYHNGDYSLLSQIFGPDIVYHETFGWRLV